MLITGLRVQQLTWEKVRLFLRQKASWLFSRVPPQESKLMQSKDGWFCFDLAEGSHNLPEVVASPLSMDLLDGWDNPDNKNQWQRLLTELILQSTCDGNGNRAYFLVFGRTKFDRAAEIDVRFSMAQQVRPVDCVLNLNHANNTALSEDCCTWKLIWSKWMAAEWWYFAATPLIVCVRSFQIGNPVNISRFPRHLVFTRVCIRNDSFSFDLFHSETTWDWAIPRNEFIRNKRASQ